MFMLVGSRKLAFVELKKMISDLGALVGLKAFFLCYLVLLSFKKSDSKRGEEGRFILLRSKWPKCTTLFASMKLRVVPLRATKTRESGVAFSKKGQYIPHCGHCGSVSGLPFISSQYLGRFGWQYG